MIMKDAVKEEDQERLTCVKTLILFNKTYSFKMKYLRVCLGMCACHSTHVAIRGQFLFLPGGGSVLHVHL